MRHRSIVRTWADGSLLWRRRGMVTGGNMQRLLLLRWWRGLLLSMHGMWRRLLWHRITHFHRIAG